MLMMKIRIPSIPGLVSILLIAVAPLANARTVELRWEDPHDSSITEYRVYARSTQATYGSSPSVVFTANEPTVDAAANDLVAPLSVNDNEIVHIVMTAYGNSLESYYSNEKTFNDDNNNGVLDSLESTSTTSPTDSTTSGSTTSGSGSTTTLPSTKAPYYINAGASTDYVDSNNHRWIPAGPYVNTGTLTSNPGIIGNTLSPTIYKTTLWNNTLVPPDQYSEMRFQFPVDPGTYMLRLHFIEAWDGAASVGARMFDIYAEDSLLIDNYDIYATAGFYNATFKEFTVNVTDGILNLDLIAMAPGNAGAAIISGIEIATNLDPLAPEPTPTLTPPGQPTIILR